MIRVLIIYSVSGIRLTRFRYVGETQSGKTTILKQFQLLNGHGFTEHERDEATLMVHDLLESLWNFGITLNPALNLEGFTRQTQVGSISSLSSAI